MRAASYITLCVLVSPAFADPVLITAAKTISPTDTTITPSAGGPPVPLVDAEITVRGAQLTVNGRHTIKSLVVERAGANAGRVVHGMNFWHDYSGNGTDIVYGFDLTILDNLTVQGVSGNLVASRIDVNGLGNVASEGQGQGGDNSVFAGGGAYGGAGANGRQSGRFYGMGGDCYGRFDQPDLFGSGGGKKGTVLGGRGGGSVRLTVGGTATIDGTVTSNGGNGLEDTGGGSGGSVWITCQTLAGSGLISVDGGSPPITGADGGGGGGGGRIAIEYSNWSFTGTTRCIGGIGVDRGGAGTLFLRQAGTDGTLIIDHDGLTGESTDFSGLDLPVVEADVIVRDGGILGATRGGGALAITFNGDVTIDPGAAISVSGRGYGPDQGPGAGVGDYYASGGSHAGKGGVGNYDHESLCYGSYELPLDLGSGGGTGHDGPGGWGGGALHMTVNGTLTNNGAIRADGTNPVYYTTGGGSGGSLWIDADTFTGNGLITANGGASGNGGGGGGGGRIRIDAQTNTFAGPIEANGGGNAYYGGAGTIYVTDPAGGLPLLLIDNDDDADDVPWTGAQITPFSGETVIDANLIVGSAAVVSHERLESGVSIRVTGNVDVEAEGVIGADGKGYLADDDGPAEGQSGPSGAGGGHGGVGGAGQTGTIGGGTHGSAIEPTDFGGAGGRGVNEAGGAGGGALRLIVDGTLYVAGRVSSNGTSFSGLAGGGAGGSLWITAGSVAGSGVISANGGSPPFYTTWGGGGGGGRVAIYTCDMQMPLAQVTASGGVGFTTGGAGSVHIAGATIDITDQPDDATVNAGDAAVFTVGASGSGILTYQWYFENEALADGGGISGAQTAQLTIDPVDCSDAGSYTCEVITACGSTGAAAATLTVIPSADFDGSGFVDTDDFDAFVLAFEAGDESADFDGTGFVDTDDFDAFVRAFESGC